MTVTPDVNSLYINDLDLLNDLIKKAVRAGADAADALLISGQSMTVACRNGSVEALERADGYDVGLRVLVGQRQAVVSSSDASLKALDELVDRAVAMARQVPEDPFVGLADPAELARDMPCLDVFDPSQASADDLIFLSREAEDAARAVPGITNSEGAEASWGTSRVALVASNGFAHSYQASGSSLSVSIVAGQASEVMERDYEWSSAVWRSDLAAPSDLGRRAGQRAVRRLGARRIKTCTVPVIFEPRVARGLLASFCSAINGVSVARGTSFLKDSLESSVFQSGVTIFEDPHRARGLKSRPIDVEGLPAVKRALVQDGTVTTWIMDLGTARQLGLKSTGHAVRGVSGPPSPSVSNVWMEKGSLSFDEMVQDVGTGLLVTDVFGQGVNLVTGDYSRGCSGFWIENGELTYPVNEITIAGNLKDMFQNLTPATDLEIMYGTDSPSVRVDGMTIAGA